MNKTIHDQIREKTRLAEIYAEDGAFITAASILEAAALTLRRRDAEIKAAMEEAGK